MIIKSFLVLTTFLSVGVMASTDYKAIQERALNSGKSSYSASELCSSSDTTCASQINNPSQASYYTSSTNSTTISKADSALAGAGKTAYNNSDMAEQSAKRDAAEVDPDLTSSSYAILNSYIKDAATNKYAACKAGTLSAGVTNTTTSCYQQTGNSVSCNYSLVPSATETTTSWGTYVTTISSTPNGSGFVNLGGGRGLASGFKVALPITVTTISAVRFDLSSVHTTNGFVVNGIKKYVSSSTVTYDDLNIQISNGSFTFYYGMMVAASAKHNITVTITLKKQVPALVWQRDCNVSVLNANGCSVASSACTSGAATKTVDGNSYTEDCWVKTDYYTCPATDTCSQYDQTGKTEDELAEGETSCSISSSNCSFTVNDVCIQKYNELSCITKRTNTFDMDCTSVSYCSSDDADQSLCTETTDLTSDTSMATALTELSLLKEFGDQFDSSTLKFFKGDADSCSKVVAGTKNCCADSGWATNAGLASCSTDEKDLAVAKGKNLTIKIGEYCADKVLGACIRKKQTYCVYTSAIAKITMQAAIDQEGASLGSAKDPDCSGVTATVLGGVDFDKVDYSSIIGNVSVTVPDMSGVSSSVADQVGSDSYSNETSN